MTSKTHNEKGNTRRIRKRGELLSFLVAAIVIIGFVAVSHYLFFGYMDREVASIQPPRNLECKNLLPLLQSEDPNLRFRASVALASCGYPQGVDALISFLLDDSNSTLQKAAAFTLLSQELTLHDATLIAKIEKQREKITKIIHPN